MCAAELRRRTPAGGAVSKHASWPSWFRNSNQEPNCRPVEWIDLHPKARSNHRPPPAEQSGAVSHPGVAEVGLQSQTTSGASQCVRQGDERYPKRAKQRDGERSDASRRGGKGPPKSAGEKIVVGREMFVLDFFFHT